MKTTRYYPQIDLTWKMVLDAMQWARNNSIPALYGFKEHQEFGSGINLYGPMRLLRYRKILIGKGNINKGHLIYFVLRENDFVLFRIYLESL